MQAQREKTRPAPVLATAQQPERPGGRITAVHAGVKSARSPFIGRDEHKEETQQIEEFVLILVAEQNRSPKSVQFRSLAAQAKERQ